MLKFDRNLLKWVLVCQKWADLLKFMGVKKFANIYCHFLLLNLPKDCGTQISRGTGVVMNVVKL